MQAKRDQNNNPPGPRGGPGTNWENPPGRAGGPGASPDRQHDRGLHRGSQDHPGLHRALGHAKQPAAHPGGGQHKVKGTRPGDATGGGAHPAGGRKR